MTPEQEKIIENEVKKDILKTRIRNLQRIWGGGNTTTARIKELKEELKKLEEGEDANTRTDKREG